MSDSKPDLKAAYSLRTPQDSIDLYRDWAKTYDADFAQANDYCYPALIAKIFAERAKDNLPVLDVGAGTGLVGEGLARQGIQTVDAIDISAEMLSVAMEKGCYCKAIRADLTMPLDISDGSYGGFTCAGTFTFGHVGPDSIDELIRIGRSGALYVLGINAALYDEGGFRAKFSELDKNIRGFELLDTPVYGKNAPEDMQRARSAVAVFYKR